MLTFFQARQKVVQPGSPDLCLTFSIGDEASSLKAESFPGWVMPSTWVINLELCSSFRTTIFLASVLHGCKKPSPGHAENMLVQKHLKINQHMEMQAVCSGQCATYVVMCQTPSFHLPQLLPLPRSWLLPLSFWQ